MLLSQSHTQFLDSDVSVRVCGISKPSNPSQLSPSLALLAAQGRYTLLFTIYVVSPPKGLHASILFTST